jgi:arsenate reductase (glutaredoxin)
MPELELIPTLYGIKNCDTVKKTRTWLDAQGVHYRFHDYKSSGIERSRLERWVIAVGWEALLNRAGTTFRQLAEADKQQLDADKAVALMLAQPSLIKRPVLESSKPLLVGFKPERYAAALALK